MKLSKSIRLASVLFLIASIFVLAVGCGDDDDDSGSTGAATATTASGGSSGASVSGTVTIEGSSTVQPFTLELIPEFQKAYPDVKVNPPSGLGSGAGITAFINKEVDIAQASRQIKQDEIDQAKAGGLDPFETTILKDALAIVVNPKNKVADLTEEEVAKIFAGEITNWSEVGGDDADITVYTRNEESGTFAYMEEDVIQKILGKESAYADNVNKQASAPAGLSAVAGDEDGIFYAGLGNLSEIPEGSVKVLKVAGTGAAVEPSEATVADGTYPISRGLFYYTDGDPSKNDNKAIGAFVDFALSADGQAIGEELGFLPITGSTAGGSTAQPTPEASDVSGTVSLEGSSTVQPFTLELIPEFEAAYPEAKVNPPSGLGSGAGITAFINKEVDIAQASRQIKQDEIDQAKAAGLDPFETTILRDALAVVVNPKNKITELTEEQVAKIFAGEITNWSEVGGDDADITVYTRNEESGTFAYMEEDVIQKVLGKESAYADNVNKQASAPAGLSAVAGDPDGIFYAGLGNLSEIPEGSVKVLKVSGTGAAVEPSAATVEDGTYPIARGLFYYTNGDPAKNDNKAIGAFVANALSPAGQAIGEGLGFLPVGPTE